MSALSENIKYEIVPGVTAALACAAYSGIPLSHLEIMVSSISFLTGHEDISKEGRVDFGEFASD